MMILKDNDYVSIYETMEKFRIVDEQEFIRFILNYLNIHFNSSLSDLDIIATSYIRRIEDYGGI